jgi:hypothetical protein
VLHCLPERDFKEEQMVDESAGQSGDQDNQEGRGAMGARRAELLRRSRDAHERLEELLATFSDEEMARRGATENWAVKDHLVHLTWWEQRVILVLSGATDPVDAIPTAEAGEDAINAHVYLQHRDRPLAEVREDFDRSYQEMMELIATAPDDVLREQYDWISGNAEQHYDDHLQMLRRWRERGMPGE